MIASFWRRLSKTKQFIEGVKIDSNSYNKVDFKNNMTNTTIMFQTRLWFIQNSPHQWVRDKYSHQLSVLHKQLNFLQSRLMLRRLLIFIGGLFFYLNFIYQEANRDWKDKFDLKFNNKTYGSLDDSSGEGAAGIDD